MIRLCEILHILRLQTWNTLEIRLLIAGEELGSKDLTESGHILLEDMSVNVIEYAYDECRECYVVFVREVFKYDEQV